MAAYVQKTILSLATVAVLSAPAAVLAAPSEALQLVYWSRGDLQKSFESSTFRAIPGTNAGFLLGLEDWAYQYGWREYAELSEYAPPVDPPVHTTSLPEPEVTAHAYIVIDRTSNQILAARRADEVWPIASLTKLMTSEVVLDAAIAPESVHPVLASDDVGGAKLYVNNGDTFTLDDLMYATLVASANNAANAVSRTPGMTREQFVADMNRRAMDLGLWRTRFVDPTGIELGNVSTAREFARFANQVFSRKDIRRYTTTATAYVDVLSTGATKTLTNTDWMLWKPEYEDVFVMAGKTGYLDESGWNFAVNLRPELQDVHRELLIVIFGSASRADSFKDTRALAEWAWDNYQWQTETAP